MRRRPTGALRPIGGRSAPPTGSRTASPAAVFGAASLLACAIACGDASALPDARADGGATDADAARPRAELVSTAAWALLPATEDPWAGHRDRPCDALALRDEESFFEVDTRTCGSASVGQAIAADIRATDVLHALVWHLDLLSDPPATGHLSLTVGDHVLLDEAVAIPSAEKLYEVRRVAGFDAPAGTRAVFHVHNHGYNNWRIAYLRVVPAD